MDDGTRGIDDGAVGWMIWTALRRPRALRRRRHRARVPRRAPKMFRLCPPWSPSPPPLPLRLPKSLRKRGSASLGASPAPCATATNIEGNKEHYWRHGRDPGAGGLRATGLPVARAPGRPHLLPRGRHRERADQQARALQLPQIVSTTTTSVVVGIVRSVASIGG
jgi:hypothetical protein